MDRKSPEEVLRSISAAFKNSGITHEIAARRLGVKSKQSIANLLYSKKYLSQIQAFRFNQAFGYDVAFMTSGLGELKPRSQKSNLENFIVKKFDFVEPECKGVTRDLLLFWMRQYFEIHHNNDGLYLCQEISTLIHAPQIISDRLVDYTGPDYKTEFEKQLNKLEEEKLYIIESMLDILP